MSLSSNTTPAVEAETESAALAELLRLSVEAAAPLWADNDDSPRPPRKLALTISKSAKMKRWDGKVELSIEDLTASLAKPRTDGNKDGVCLIGGQLAGDQRKAQAVVHSDILIYDIDGGQTLAEVEKIMDDSGVYALIYTTFSNLTTKTRIQADHYETWAKRAGEAFPPNLESMTAYLKSHKKEHIAAAHPIFDPKADLERFYVHDENGHAYIVHHDPIEKFRVMLPLAERLIMTELGIGSRRSINAYKSIYHGVGQALGLKYDHACEDPSRLHYFPSVRKGEEGNYQARVCGTTAKLLRVADYPRVEVKDSEPRTKPRREGPQTHIVTDKDGATINLDKLPRDFDIEGLLSETLDDDMIKADRAGKDGFHIECPFESNHSTTGGLGTFCANGDDDRSWTIYCSHNSCHGHDRDDYLAEFVRQGFVTAEDLKGEAEPETEEPLSEEIQEAIDTEDFVPLLVQTFEDWPRYEAYRYGVGSALVEREPIRLAAADAGLTAEYERDLALSRDLARSNLAITTASYRVERDGSITVTMHKGKDTEYEAGVCSPIMFISDGYNAERRGACVMVRVKNPWGQWTDVLIPRADLQSRGPWLTPLLDAGLVPEDPKKLLSVLQGVRPPKKVRRFERSGWYEGTRVYVQPSGETIPAGIDALITFTPQPGYGVGGAKTEHDAMLRDITGNSNFMYAYAHTLSAPYYLHAAGEAENGIINYFHGSSCGKTTAMVFAASATGKGDLAKNGGIVYDANGTTNGIVALAEAHNDAAMFLDEMGTSDGAGAMQSTYALANGSGKLRAKQDGNARKAKTFRASVMQTSEVDTRTTATADGKGKYRAGMSVRALDIPAMTDSPHGTFDVLPERFSGNAAAFAKHIKKTAAQHYGWYNVAMIERFQADPEGFMAAIREAAAAVRAQLPDADSDAQSGRVADKVAFVTGVGIASGIWSVEDMTAAGVSVWNRWFERRGGKGSSEGIEGERAFTAFVATRPGEFHSVNERATYTRVGVRTVDGDAHGLYWFASDEALERVLGAPERLPAFIKRLKDGLSEDWELVADKGRDKKESPKNCGLPKRTYCVRTKRPVLENENDEI